MGLRSTSSLGKRRKGQNQKLLLIASAGLAFSLAVVLVVILKYRSDSNTNGGTLVAPTVGSIPLLVSEKQIESGRKLDQVRFREILWPRDAVPEGSIRDRAELAGYFAKVTIPAGVPLQRVHMTNQRSAVTLPVTPGNRAVTIEVDAVSGLEGLALPGSSVDVVLTHSKNGELVSEVIVQNARVLASGKNTSAQGGVPGISSPTAKTPRTITLDVSPGDALKISNGRQLGRLSLLIRDPGDNSNITNTIMTQGGISKGNKKEGVSKKKECTVAHFRSGGKEYQLNCDGTTVQLSSMEDDF